MPSDSEVVSSRAAEKARVQLLNALDSGIRANRELRRALQEGERATLRIRRALEKGEPLARVAERTDFRTTREAMSVAVEEFETSRHRFKVAAFILAHAEATSIGKLSRLWGISRQLGARYAREAGITKPQM
jgi:hypothetical protein